jgi:hypothetical protein
MTHNPILEEIYAAREKLLADCNGDFHAYVESARQRALSSGKRIVTPKDYTAPSTPAAQPPPPQRQA